MVYMQLSAGAHSLSHFLVSIFASSDIRFCRDFSCIMVPLQSSMTVTLPAGISDSTKHNAFPGFQPTIERFDEKVCGYLILILMRGHFLPPLTCRWKFYHHCRNRRKSLHVVAMARHMFYSASQKYGGIHSL